MKVAIVLLLVLTVHVIYGIGYMVSLYLHDKKEIEIDLYRILQIAYVEPLKESCPLAPNRPQESYELKRLKEKRSVVASKFDDFKKEVSKTRSKGTSFTDASEWLIKDENKRYKEVLRDINYEIERLEKKEDGFFRNTPEYKAWEQEVDNIKERERARMAEISKNREIFKTMKKMIFETEKPNISEIRLELARK
jgi:predicted  nucleic acid-binding Zn-ribbon protein